MSSEEKFIKTLQEEIDATDFYEISYATILNFHKKFSTFLHRFKKLENPDCVISIAECCLRFISFIQYYVDSSNMLNQNKMETLIQCLTVIDEIAGVQNAQKVFIMCITATILQKVAEPDIKLWFARELITSFNIAMQGINRKVRNIIVNENIFNICKLADIICLCGDYQYQLALLETIFRLCSPEQINEHAGKMFPTSDEFKYGICNIDRMSFQRDSRIFLNMINSKSKKVLSIKCNQALLGITEISPPMYSKEEASMLWVDFNLGSKTVTINCDKSSLLSNSPESQSDTNDDFELITVYAANVDQVQMKSISIGNSSTPIYSFIFKMDKPCSVRFDSSYPVANYPLLKLAIAHCVEVDKLITRVFPDWFGNKFMSGTQSSQESSSSNVAVTEPRSPAAFSAKSTKSSTSDAMSLKGKLDKYHGNRFSKQLSRWRSKSPTIRNLHELKKLADDPDYARMEKEQEEKRKERSTNKIVEDQDQNGSQEILARSRSAVRVTHEFRETVKGVIDDDIEIIEPISESDCQPENTKRKVHTIANHTFRVNTITDDDDDDDCVIITENYQIAKNNKIENEKNTIMQDTAERTEQIVEIIHEFFEIPNKNLNVSRKIQSNKKAEMSEDSDIFNENELANNKESARLEKTTESSDIEKYIVQIGNEFMDNEEIITINSTPPHPVEPCSTADVFIVGELAENPNLPKEDIGDILIHMVPNLTDSELSQLKAAMDKNGPHDQIPFGSEETSKTSISEPFVSDCNSEKIYEAEAENTENIQKQGGSCDIVESSQLDETIKDLSYHSITNLKKKKRPSSGECSIENVRKEGKVVNSSSETKQTNSEDEIVESEVTKINLTDQNDEIELVYQMDATCKSTSTNEFLEQNISKQKPSKTVGRHTPKENKQKKGIAYLKDLSKKKESHGANEMQQSDHVKNETGKASNNIKMKQDKILKKKGNQLELNVSTKQLPQHNNKPDEGSVITENGTLRANFQMDKDCVEQGLVKIAKSKNDKGMGNRGNRISKKRKTNDSENPTSSGEFIAKEKSEKKLRSKSEKYNTAVNRVKKVSNNKQQKNILIKANDHSLHQHEHSEIVLNKTKAKPLDECDDAINYDKFDKVLKDIGLHLRANHSSPLQVNNLNDDLERADNDDNLSLHHSEHSEICIKRRKTIPLDSSYDSDDEIFKESHKNDNQALYQNEYFGEVRKKVEISTAPPSPLNTTVIIADEIKNKTLKLKASLLDNQKPLRSSAQRKKEIDDDDNGIVNDQCLQDSSDNNKETLINKQGKPSKDINESNCLHHEGNISELHKKNESEINNLQLQLLEVNSVKNSKLPRKSARTNKISNSTTGTKLIEKHTNDACLIEKPQTRAAKKKYNEKRKSSEQSDKSNKENSPRKPNIDETGNSEIDQQLIVETNRASTRRMRRCRSRSKSRKLYKLNDSSYLEYTEESKMDEIVDVNDDFNSIDNASLLTTHKSIELVGKIAGEQSTFRHQQEQMIIANQQNGDVHNVANLNQQSMSEDVNGNLEQILSRKIQEKELINVPVKRQTAFETPKDNRTLSTSRLQNKLNFDILINTMKQTFNAHKNIMNSYHNSVKSKYKKNKCKRLSRVGRKSLRRTTTNCQIEDDEINHDDTIVVLNSTDDSESYNMAEQKKSYEILKRDLGAVTKDLNDLKRRVHKLEGIVQNANQQKR